MRDPSKVGANDMQQAFASSNLEPEIDEELLLAYVAGRADAVEREIVESRAEVDPILKSTIDVMREELGGARLANPIDIKPQRPARPWLGWLAVLNGGLAIAATAAVVFFVTDNKALENRAFSLQSSANKNSEQLKDLQASLVAKTAESSNLKQQMASMRHQIGGLTQESDRLNQQLVAMRNTGHATPIGKEYVRVGDQIAHYVPQTDPVSEALLGKLDVPAISVDPPGTRGAIDSRIALSPDNTAVLPPISLVWKGSPPGTDWLLEVYDGATSVLTGKVSGSKMALDPAKLLPGHSYAWRIRSANSSSRWASFRVLDGRSQQKARDILSDATMKPLDKGVRLARLGLVQAAAGQFAELAKTDPSLARTLSRQLDAATQRDQGP